MMRRASAGLYALPLMLAGCTTVGPDYQRPAASVAQAPAANAAFSAAADRAFASPAQPLSRDALTMLSHGMLWKRGS